MGLVKRIPIPIKIARRLIEYNEITVPFDLDELVKKYAKLIYRQIPISGIDGVTLNLKVPGKVPTVVVNSSMPKTRQKFTLAHELGHILIPSHTGTIVDDTQFTQEALNWQYFDLEQEANTFAAELLMPQAWMEKMCDKFKANLENLHYQITSRTGVSDLAAAIRLIQVLPPNFAFLAVESGTIVSSGRTDRSTARLPHRGTEFDGNFFKSVRHSSTYHSGMVLYHWYDLNGTAELKIDHDERSWRDILDAILREVISSEYSRTQVKKGINGIVSAANGTAKQNGNYSVESVIVAITHRMQGRDDHFENYITAAQTRKILKHKNFVTFIHKRAYDFYHGIKK